MSDAPRFYVKEKKNAANEMPQYLLTILILRCIPLSEMSECEKCTPNSTPKSTPNNDIMGYITLIY